MSGLHMSRDTPLLALPLPLTRTRQCASVIYSRIGVKELRCFYEFSTGIGYQVNSSHADRRRYGLAHRRHPPPPLLLVRPSSSSATTSI
jgi:hypothetical protein